MIVDVLRSRILKNLGHEPTEDQAEAIDTFCAFVSDFNTDSAMILCGAAGTGKTTLAASIVKSMKSLGQKVVLLAPTGRAAKVFSLNADTPAFTIHRKIYRQKAYTGLGGMFQIGDNMASNTLFLVDEASMINNSPSYVGGQQSEIFGSGELLEDLIRFVYNGSCRMLLIGDRYQLPPVGSQTSPALDDTALKLRGLSVYRSNLEAVVRQANESGILFNATKTRAWHQTQIEGVWPKIVFRGFKDVVSVSGEELIDSLCNSYYHAGIDETMVVTRSNKQAVRCNNGIRAYCLDREEELESGDMIMVVKNNYYWTERDKYAPMPFIANGDRARIRRIRNNRDLYGFHFCDCTLEFPDYDNYEMTVTVMKDSLQSESPSLTREQQEILFNAVMEDYADIPLKSDRLKALKEDMHYNALQIKFAYASTCHKAQGGQWEHVYIYQGEVSIDKMNSDYYRWLYTAITRATEKLFLVNWRNEPRTNP